MSKPIIAVVGATGAQGGGVVEAVLQRGTFAVRALTRHPDSDRARALAARGVQVVRADLNDPQTLPAAFAGAHGAFVVTNFWDAATGDRETAQGVAAVTAARHAGVSHLVWSTLPDADALSGGQHHVAHFTSKAHVDAAVDAAGFTHHTFVEAPMYYQNLLTRGGPQTLPGGRRGWALPIDPAARCVHLGDVRDVGKVVARVFEQPDRVGQGQHLGVAPGPMSWNELVEALNAQGHDLVVTQVPPEAYDGFFPGAPEMRHMFQWFEGYTYFGPDADKKIALAKQVYPDGFTAFAAWSAEHMTKAG